MAAKRKYTRKSPESVISRKKAPTPISGKIKSFLSSIIKFFVGSWKRAIIFVILIVVAVIVGRNYFSEPQGATTQKVARGTLKTTVSANGSVKTRIYVDLKFSSPGEVSWVGVTEGDKVRTSQTLAMLNTTALNASYEQSLNNLRNYQAIAESVLDSVQGHSTDETYAMRATRTTAEVNRDNAYESIVSAGYALGNAGLVAPIDGIIADTNNLIPGMNLTGADLESKFIRIIDKDSMYFEAELDEIDYASVYIGQEVDVSVDAYPNNACKGEVSKIATEGDETAGGVVVVPIEIKFTRCNLNLVTGFNGEAQFITDKKLDVLTVPKKYIVDKDGGKYVWLQTGDSIRSRKLAPVETGMETASEVEIVNGVNEGDTIIYIPQG